MLDEVKNEEITEDDLSAFEEAQEEGKIEDGSEERTLETEKEEKEEEIDEDKDDEEEVSEDTADSSKAEIKEVAGETPKERALRLEVTRLKRAARQKSQDEIFKQDKAKVSEDDYQELKDLGYDEDQIKTLDKAFDIIGTKKGFVRKDQTWKETAQSTLEQFIEENPEYAPENDKEDVYWGRFNEILKNDYNIAGKNPKQLKSIFERVDRDVEEELGDNESKEGKLEAKKQKIRSVSAGAAASTVKSGESKTVVNSGNKTYVSSNHPGLVFKGFDEDEVKEFIK